MPAEMPIADVTFNVVPVLPTLSYAVDTLSVEVYDNLKTVPLLPVAPIYNTEFPNSNVSPNNWPSSGDGLIILSTKL